MPEIKTDPFIFWKEVDGDIWECEGFGPDHSLSDIARWICRNRADAEEMLYLIKDQLENHN